MDRGGIHKIEKMRAEVCLRDSHKCTFRSEEPIVFIAIQEKVLSPQVWMALGLRQVIKAEDFGITNLSVVIESLRRNEIDFRKSIERKDTAYRLETYEYKCFWNIQRYLRNCFQGYEMTGKIGIHELMFRKDSEGNC